MTLTKGTLFKHRHWVEEDRTTPLTCRVTTVRHGIVYWRDANAGPGPAQYTFPLVDAAKYVLDIVTGQGVK